MWLKNPIHNQDFSPVSIVKRHLKAILVGFVAIILNVKKIGMRKKKRGQNNQLKEMGKRRTQIILVQFVEATKV